MERSPPPNLVHFGKNLKLFSFFDILYPKEINDKREFVDYVIPSKKPSSLNRHNQNVVIGEKLAFEEVKHCIILVNWCNYIFK